MNGNNNHLDPLISLFNLGTNIYGITSSNTGSTLYNVNPSTLLTELITTTTTPSISAVGGGMILTNNNGSPLKKINNTSATNNQIGMVGSETFHITQIASDTIRFDLPVKDQYLNVNRTTQYV